LKYGNVAGIAGAVFEIEGGSLEVKNIVVESNFNARVINISPGLEAPGKGHNHDGNETYYVISGDTVYHDGTTTFPFTVGDFALVEPFELHWLVSEEEGITIFEIVRP